MRLEVLGAVVEVLGDLVLLARRPASSRCRAMPSARRSKSRPGDARSPCIWAGASGMLGRDPPRRRRSSSPALLPLGQCERPRMLAVRGVLDRMVKSGATVRPWTSSCRPTTIRDGWRCGRGWRSTRTPTGRQLAEAGYVAPHWPAPWGLDADPIHQILIDEELRRCRGAPADQHDRHRLGGPDPRPRRHRGAEGALPLPAARRRGDLVPALQRAGAGLRPRRRCRPGPSATATSGSSTARRSGPRWPSSPSSAS